MQLSFHSLLASAQEVDFFTDIILDTGLSGDLEPDTSFVTGLESIPPAIIEAEKEAAIEEQWEIEMAYDEESLQFEYSVVILNHTNDTVEEEWGTWEDCTKFVVRYQRLMFGHRFDARFFHAGDDNEYASVQFNPTPSDPTGYLTLTMPRRY